MNIEEAIEQACADVGITVPKVRGYGKWLQTDTLSGRNGKGDGRLMINDLHVTAWNWQTGEMKTIGLKNSSLDHAGRHEITRLMDVAKHKKAADARRAATIAGRLVGQAALERHSYLAGKGFPDAKVLVISADEVRSLAGAYLVPASGHRAIVMPARKGSVVTSAQLIWEDGTKKFLFGGEIAGASYRIAAGDDAWLCEGMATGFSIRSALKGFGRSATILCCFSASNIAAVARSISGRCFIASDNDKPLEQFGGLGAGEFHARATRKPYVMPPTVGDDFNDMHMAGDIFGVQRHLSSFLQEVAM
jgi:putative DNA primase/helicase